MATVTDENLMKNTSQDFKTKVEGTEKSFEQMAQNVGRNIAERAKDIERAASTYVDSSRKYVQENPVKSLVIAAAAGAIAGSLVSFTLNRRH